MLGITALDLTFALEHLSACPAHRVAVRGTSRHRSRHYSHGSPQVTGDAFMADFKDALVAQGIDDVEISLLQAEG